MNFFADESLDRQIIARLRQDGHAVLDVTEMENHPDFVVGNPDDLIHFDWSSESEPQL